MRMRKMRLITELERQRKYLAGKQVVAKRHQPGESAHTAAMRSSEAALGRATEIQQELLTRFMWREEQPEAKGVLVRFGDVKIGSVVKFNGRLYCKIAEIEACARRLHQPRNAKTDSGEFIRIPVKNIVLVLLTETESEA